MVLQVTLADISLIARIFATLPVKVSATLQDRLRADRSSFCCFHEKPYKLCIFGSLIIPENYFY